LGAYQPVQPLGCRCCGAGLTEEVADLGLVPLSPDPVRVGAGWRPLACAPLRLFVCSDCRLVQVGATGTVGRNHAPRAGQDFAAGIAQRLRLGPGTPVAAFDAEALAPFRDRDIPASTIPTGALMALRLREALPPPVLLLGGPLLANAPDLRDALEGVRTLLAPGGVAVFDMPDLLARLEGNRFDLLSHAMPSLPSLLVAEMLLGLHGLVPFELEAVPGSGPWLRLLVRHAEDSTKPVGPCVLARRETERAAGLEGPEAYARAAVAVAEARLAVLDLLVAARREGRRVAGYGAGPAAVTLAAACGLGPGLLAFTVDATFGQGRLELPGSRIPVLLPSALDQASPDLLLVLDATPMPVARGLIEAWGSWQGRIALPLPALHIV